MTYDVQNLRLGIDIGSTTAKIVIISPQTSNILFERYERHNARQKETLQSLLKEALRDFSKDSFRVAVCGSGGKTIAKALNVHYIQEVVANSAAVRTLYPETRTAIELGGQDAKVVFFYFDQQKKQLLTSDMRMNGSCAGGTGAFIDEIAKLLHIPTEDFESLAEKGTHTYDISGRCGVFAKTDIQPLLISGAKKEDIALSTFHAIAKQTIGGLSQGLELKAPIIFEGGPLTFNPKLIDVFAERLKLAEKDIIVPAHSETIVAYGTAIALDQLFPAKDNEDLCNIRSLLEKLDTPLQITKEEKTTPFFNNKDDYELFMVRHNAELKQNELIPQHNEKMEVYLGIDSGSTTSKCVLLNKNEQVIDRFYANNHGDPVRVIRNELITMKRKYDKQGIKLDIIGMGTTGYGENLFAKILGADYHTVETVAHATGCVQYYPEATFILDIGGQDMKAIWLKDGIITNIMLNEACSSGCGSFLENFADNLNIPVSEIADRAFSSTAPAKLGSRCTVFMNSTIINEQRNGKSPNDLMAGLCRSIIENVFTKVVRIGHTAQLGDHIVVQGGTFRNRAVLRAIEEYLGKEVKLAPYPGEMGALGASLAAKNHIEKFGYKNGKCTSFIGLSNLENFDYTLQTGVPCANCGNHCSRTIMTFTNDREWITGNRCEKGAMTVPDKAISQQYIDSQNASDMFVLREQWLFKEYPFSRTVKKKKEIIGLPRTLEFWDSMPFWSTFFKALGYETRFSHQSNRKMYETGLQYVTSDTICFPAKLVHGHIADLAGQKVDRIFMPFMMHIPPEGTDKLSPYMCSIVMGYPMVVQNSQNPEKNYNVKFDTPVFHWYNAKDRKSQIIKYAMTQLDVSKKQAEAAFSDGESALLQFRNDLRKCGQQLIDKVTKEGKYAVVLSGRPYHTDSFVCHNISKKFADKGIPVLTVDSLPGMEKVDLSHTIIEITNNFHTRMLAGAMCAARNTALEYVQIVSFGCGHDAILSDEIVRITSECGNKTPLILKLDESDATGALGIRIQSFIETVDARRKNRIRLKENINLSSELSIPSPVKFHKEDKKRKLLLFPNISEEISVILSAVLEKEGFRAKSVPLGGSEQVTLGKQYVHNDICFPCQMVIGELISAIQKTQYRQEDIAVGMVKFQCDCRLSHYGGLLRKGLDSAGLHDVAILTTDVNDTKKMHPGIAVFDFSTLISAVWAIMMLDILTSLTRKIRPYEMNKGETDNVYQQCVIKIADAIKISIRKAKKAFSECIDDLNKIEYDRSTLKPLVFVTGEILVTFHAGTNYRIERYLEQNGMETAFPGFMDQQRKDFRAAICRVKDFNADKAFAPFLSDFLVDHIQSELDKTAKRHKLYQPVIPPKILYKEVSDIIPETLSPGEGWLMAADIAHYAKQGTKSFIILQPFGCLPNHICGRGVIKKMKEKYPDIQILPLDLDPDTSFANIENRLQMLIMRQ